jgi:hypothetical protein
MTILDIIIHPVFELKHDVSKPEFCLRLQVIDSSPKGRGLNK